MSTAVKLSLLIVIVTLGLVLAAIAPGYFARENLSDLFLGNMPVLHRGDRHDPGDPHRQHRHLGRLGVRHLRGRCGHGRQGVRLGVGRSARSVCGWARRLAR